jgi:tetratricopeptide (TPR) repeat protein
MEKQGNFISAISEYRAILAQDGSIRDAYMNLGCVYSRLGRFSDAMKVYRDCLALGSDYLLYFNMGSICYKLGSYKNAVINLERARKMNSGFALATLVIGLSYSRMGNIRAAEVNFQKVLRMWPSNRVALTALSIMYFHQERYEESLALLERLIA